jgi:amino acid transporter
MYTAAAVYLFYLATSVAVIVLRRRDPSAPRSYRAAGFPVTTLIFCAVCGFLIVSAVDYRPMMALASLAVIVLGVPAFWLSERFGGWASSAVPEVISDPAFRVAFGDPASPEQRGRCSGRCR